MKQMKEQHLQQTEKMKEQNLQQMEKMKERHLQEMEIIDIMEKICMSSNSSSLSLSLFHEGSERTELFYAIMAILTAVRIVRESNLSRPMACVGIASVTDLMICRFFFITINKEKRFVE